MKVAIGSDHLGFALKQILKEFVQTELGFEVVDCGCFDESPVDYPDVGVNVARKIAEGTCERGLLICGTGIGMSMAANKVPGIRAAQCPDILTAQRARWANDAHIMTLGALITGPELSKMLVKVFLTTEFGNDPTVVGRLNKLKELDVRHRGEGQVAG